MSTTRYDRYGRLVGSPIECAPEPFVITVASNTTQYVRYYDTGDGPGVTRRIVAVNNATQICVAWCAASDSASATYYPVNSIFEVDDETGAVVHVYSNGAEASPVAALDAE